MRIYDKILIFGALLNGLKGSDELESRLRKEKKLFIEYEELYSGWYTRGWESTRFIKEADNDGGLIKLKFDFYKNEQGWNLVEWSNYYGRTTRVPILLRNESLSNLIETRLTNYVPRKKSRSNKKPNAGSRRSLASKSFKASIEPLVTVTNDNWVVNENETTSAVRLNEKSEDTEASTHQDVLPVENKSTAEKSTPELKIYLDKKCKCSHILVQREGQLPIQFTRLDLSTHLEKCIHEGRIIIFLDIMPEKYKSLIMKNLNEITSLSRIFMLVETESTKQDSWYPEFYLGSACDMVHYHPEFDLWIADFGQYCYNGNSQLELYWAKNTSPCIENLPPTKHQKWMKYQKVKNITEPSEQVLNICDHYYQETEATSFTINCVHIQ